MKKIVLLCVLGFTCLTLAMNVDELNIDELLESKDITIVVNSIKNNTGRDIQIAARSNSNITVAVPAGQQVLWGYTLPIIPGFPPANVGKSDDFMIQGWLDFGPEVQSMVGFYVVVQAHIETKKIVTLSAEMKFETSEGEQDQLQYDLSGEFSQYFIDIIFEDSFDNSRIIVHVPSSKESCR